MATAIRVVNEAGGIRRLIPPYVFAASQLNAFANASSAVEALPTNAQPAYAT
ncbi:hypothetical protein HMY34_07260 [Thiothrix subterranea]|uniref:hypothetical protein n=1 Tax=Thiothrix subterranea TaxID=2735563 RepID=UPI00192CB8C4|nr:hypothetical protein [Thiothrix subterranea]QQZ27258.1 hypothetical protein HMY34_07260 [Thiothrix subterranea]